MKRVQIHLTETQIGWLKNISNQTGLPVSEHIRRAVDQYIASDVDNKITNEILAKTIKSPVFFKPDHRA